MPTSTELEDNVVDKRRYRIGAAVFVTTVATVSAVVGFSRTVAAAKKREHKILEKAGSNAAELLEGGSALAMRALGWGTLYAILGTGVFCYGVWKLSGAKNMEEFRQKMGSTLPRITKDEPPSSRTDFDGLTDLIKYLSTWGRE